MNMTMKKNHKLKKVYVDMDGVLVDFQHGIDRLSDEDRNKYEGKYKDCPNIFRLMRPIDGALDGYRTLAERFDIYILSTAPWNNPTAWNEKLEWVQKHLGDVAYKRLILSHHKNLNKGDYLIDDRDANGAAQFDGELIKFGSERFPDWKTVVRYLMEVAA
jgi:5'(3')-deoxyribonucleotidase